MKMKGWEWALLVVGGLLAIGAGIMLFFRYYPQYHPDYLAWKRENPEAPAIQYQIDKAAKEGRKNSDGGGAGSSLKTAGG